MPDGNGGGGERNVLYGEKIEVQCTSEWKRAVRVAAAEEGLTMAAYVRKHLPAGGDD